MPLSFLSKPSRTPLNVVILSAACCAPGMEPFDDAARRVVEQAVSETSVAAQVRLLPATSALFGAVPKPILAEVIKRAQSGQVPVPAIIVNGAAVSYGVPTVEQIKSALIQADRRERNLTREGSDGSPA